ncbi:MAG TPA: hypothetical protein VM711_03650 [Sphingomicrobium sp.]|nr:hypothetical protein [Sphingomicrobium sp.]
MPQSAQNVRTTPEDEAKRCGTPLVIVKFPRSKVSHATEGEALAFRHVRQWQIVDASGAAVT